MKVIIKKEYDTVEVVEKLEKVLRKSVTNNAQVIIDKDDIKDVINILKYFDNDYQVYKSETLKKAEKLEEEVERFKTQRKQHESSVDKEGMCHDCIWKDTDNCHCDCSRERKTITELKAIRDCFGKYTIGESLERECCDCKYVIRCLHETAEKKVSENE